MALKILLAEDEVSLSRVYTAALEHQGYEVVAVANGQEAVDRGRKEAFDVFILDIMMPVKTGLEALAELRSARQYLPYPDANSHESAGRQDYRPG